MYWITMIAMIAGGLMVLGWAIGPVGPYTTPKKPSQFLLLVAIVLAWGGIIGLLVGIFGLGGGGAPPIWRR